MTSRRLPPSIDPAQRTSPFGTIQFIIDEMVKKDMDGMLPARVVAFDRTKNRVSVQIMVAMISTEKKQVVRAQIASVPVLQLGGGGFVLSFPIAAGDLGWIKATDVDISLFLQSIKSNGGVISPPNTRIMHKFDSAMFIPDTMFKNVTIHGGDADNVVLQTLDGNTRISIGNGTINIFAPTAMNITTPILTVNGQIIATGDVHGQGTSLHTHVHPDPQGGLTGPPV